MNADIARAYDRLPYPDFAFWASHPDHIGMFGRLFGIATAHPDRCRVLEIGCAVGGNLLPMAANHPGSHFVGVDLSGVQIARAKVSADAIGLRNVTLIHGDFREVPARLGPFDYIICHGVFAWVDRATQPAILQFMRDHLSVDGVGFVSYNAYPGQHMVDMVRKLLAVHTAHAPNLDTKFEQSLAVMRFLRDSSDIKKGDWRSSFLELEIKHMEESGIDFLEHDYCSVESSPMYFSDFVKLCTKSGLAYLADSSPWNMYLDNHSPAIVENLRPLEDLVRQGQYLDFVQHSRYRETLICRADSTLTRDVPSSRIHAFYIGQALSAKPSLDGIAEGKPTEYLVANRPAMTIAHPLLRLALHRLWLHGRAMVTYDQLVAEVLEDLDTHGIELDRGTVRDRLGAQLLRAFFGCAVRFTLSRPALARTIPDHPKTGPYQRYMARDRRPAITSLTHEVFEGTPTMHALLPHLDGTRTHAELQALCTEPILDALSELRRKGYLLA